MAIVIKKNTVDISSSIDTRSVVVTFVLTKEVSRLQFNIKNTPTKASCDLGDQIDVYEGSDHIFGGTVTEKNDEVAGGILIATHYTVNDWSFRLNSKLVIRNYEEEDPQTIVNDIIASFTDGTFGTTGVVLAGYDIPSIKFNYEQVTASIEKVAKQIGWEWYVDADKEVQFFPPSVIVNAPYTIDDTMGNLEWRTLNIEQSLINMKNSVYVIGGTYSKVLDASTTPDKYLTDGTKTVFTIAYPYTADTIVVTLAGVSQTIGTDQITDPGTVQVLYNQASRFIRFTSVPTTAQEVRVYGTAEIPILAHVQNESAILAYGEIQDAIIDPQIKSTEEAQARGNAQISQFGTPVYAVKFSTLKTGFRVGQTVQVDSTLFGEEVMVIIKRITGRMYSPTQMRYEIECVGTEKVSFVDIMKFLLLREKTDTVVADNTVLQVLLLFSELTNVFDNTSDPTSTSAPYVWDAAVASRYNLATWS